MGIWKDTKSSTIACHFVVNQKAKHNTVLGWRRTVARERLQILEPRPKGKSESTDLLIFVGTSQEE